MSLAERYYSLGRLDRLSYQDTWVHRLDPRAKVIAVMGFVLTTISFPPYEVAGLAPLLLFPALLAALADIPLSFVARKVAVVSPFAILVGIFNPVLDDRTAAVIAGVPVSAGWLSFLSLLGKFCLTTAAAILLVATTSFPGVCRALRRLGAPAPFVAQLQFLYRYLFVLLEEALRLGRARDLRSFGKKGRGLRVYARLVGMLFVRTVERAERIYLAMLSRGFRGDMPGLARPGMKAADLFFLAAAAFFLLAVRLYPLSEKVGRLFEGVVS